MLPTQPGTTPAETESAAPPPDFDALVADLLAHPERAADASAIGDDYLAEVLRRLNPYAACVPTSATPNFKQVIACSYTNLREDYIRRFAVTATTGFLFQVAGEWEPPASARRWTPASRAAKDAANTVPFVAESLKERAATIMSVAEEAATAAADVTAAGEAARAAAAASLVAAEAETTGRAAGATGGDADVLAAASASAAAAAKQAEVELVDAEARAAGLLYAATHLLAGAGSDAEKRMHATAAAGFKYPAVREVLTQFPLPPPPAQIEAPVEVARALIYDFLLNWLNFDTARHVRAGRDRPTAAGASARAAVAARAAEIAAGKPPKPLDPADPAHATVEELVAPAPSAAAEHVETLAALISTPKRINAALAALRVGAGALASALVLLGAVAPTVASREAVDDLLGNVSFANAIALAAASPNRYSAAITAGNTDDVIDVDDAATVATILAHPRGAAAFAAAVADSGLAAAAAALGAVDVSAGADAPASVTATAITVALGAADFGTALAAASASEESAAAFRAYLWPRAAAAVPFALRHVPPQDTFHRLNYYAEVNYESLRSVTEALYPERADLDWVIMPWAVFGGKPAEVDAEFDKYCSRYSDEVPSAVRSIDVGSWTFLGDFGGNRDKINFYNRNTDVLKRIMDRHAEDKKLGAELMRRRVEDKKMENIAEAGPDAPGLNAYRREAGGKSKTPAALGAERVIGAEKLKRMEAARGSRVAMAELEQFEEYKKRVADLEKEVAAHPTNTSAVEQLSNARHELVRAKEMLAVPDNAIQIDAFHFDAGAGTFDRKIMYTEAETPEETAARASAASSGSVAPARREPLPPLAPYAVAALEADLADEKAVSEIKTLQ
jgi:hypothetical protein